jgi:hypothetical protein
MGSLRGAEQRTIQREKKEVKGKEEKNKNHRICFLFIYFFFASHTFFF